MSGLCAKQNIVVLDIDIVVIAVAVFAADSQAPQGRKAPVALDGNAGDLATEQLDGFVLLLEREETQAELLARDTTGEVQRGARELHDVLDHGPSPPVG